MAKRFNGYPTFPVSISFRFRARHLRLRCRPMSGHVGSAISKSAMVENVGVACGIASPSVFVQMLFVFPVSTSGFVADIRASDVGRCQAVSAMPCLSRAWSKKLGWTLESLCHLFSFKSYFHFRFCDRHLCFWCRSVSDRVGSAVPRAEMVENMGEGAAIDSSHVSVQKLFPFSVSTSGFVADIRASDVGRCLAVSAVPYLSRACSKMWYLQCPRLCKKD